MRFDTQTDASLMSNVEYYQCMRTLNEEQRKIVMYHRNWCKNVIESRKLKQTVKPYHLFLSGAGGVGKSHVIKLLKHDTVKFMRHLPNVNPQDVTCLTLAPTGAAAFNINGLTIHSGLLIIPIHASSFKNLSTDNLNTLRSKLENLKVVIIDEISMVGATLFHQIHRRLEEIIGTNSFDSLFGNMTLIAVGDLYQLPPVGGNFIFDLPRDPYALLHEPLWNTFSLAELTTVMRQKEDKHFVDILNRVRTGSCTVSDIQILKSRQVKKGDASLLEKLHVFPKNDDVSEHNIMKLSHLETKKYSIHAIDSKKDRNTGQLEAIMPQKRSDTSGLTNVLDIAVGARVMLTYNINTSDGWSMELWVLS